MTALALLAAMTVAIIDPRESPAVQQSERLRFRQDLCTAWHSSRAERLILVIASVDHSVRWTVEIESLAEGERIASLRSSETFQVFEPAENGELKARPVEGKTEQTYDMLDLLVPGTTEIAPRGERDCEAVGRGKLVLRLRFAKTGRDASW